MAKKRVVLLRSNPVNPDSRVEKETSALADFGFDVTVLCWDRDSDYKIQIGSLSDSRIRVIRIGCKASFGEGLKNIIPYLKFQFGMRKWLIKHREEYDLIHACDFDTANFTLSIARHYNKLFIFDIFDFLCGDPKNLLQRIVKKRQLGIINHSDATIICNEERKVQIKGSTPKQLAVIHNSPPEIVLDDNSVSLPGEVKIVYVGILSDNRLLKEEVEVFKKHRDWFFYVGGFGLHKDFFESTSKEYDNIVFMGKLPYEDTLKLERTADILLAVYDPAIENHRFAAPNKFYEGLMLGKPLVMVKNTGMSSEVENNKVGVLIDYSAKGFEDGIQSLLERRNEWPEMKTKMINLYKEKYSWSEMRNRLRDLYENVCSGENK